MLQKVLLDYQVNAGPHKYVVGVKEAKNKAKYLFIQEVKKSGELISRVIVFEEYIKEFQQQLRKLFRFVKQAREEKFYPKSKLTWTELDVMKLVDLYKKSETVKNMAKILKRKPRVVRKKIKQLEQAYWQI